MKKKLAFLGLSHLSSSYLLASIAKGYNIIAYDTSLDALNSYQNNNPKLDEVDLIKRLKKEKKKISYTNKISDIRKSDIIFIALDVKTNSHNISNYDLIHLYLKKLQKLKIKNIPIVILSQVYPGFLRKIKLKNNLYYQVETLIFGKGYKRALLPERIIVGKKSKEEKLHKNYNNYLKKFKCPIFEMNYESAEICKIAINIILASTLTSANILASLTENIGANFLDIIPALNSDKRIGKKSYIYPGLGISGGNIERDLVVVKKLLKKQKINYNFIQSILSFSDYQKNWVFKKLKDLKRINRVSILGLSYKKNNHSIKNSPSLELISKLKKHNIDFCIYDEHFKSYKDYNFTNNLLYAVSSSNCVIIMRDFINIDKIKKICKQALEGNKTVIDPFNVLKDIRNKSKFKYFTIGE